MKQRIDPVLLKKLSDKSGKSEKYVREQVSKKAGRLGISSEAALVLLAKEQCISAGRFLRKQSPHVQNEVRSTLSQGDMEPKTKYRSRIRDVSKSRRSEKQFLGEIIDDLIQDDTLRERCRDLLLARKNFDRVFREATTVFDDRLKNLTGVTNMKPADLVGWALNPDPAKAVLVVSNEKHEQEGFFNICKGIVLAFRDPTHHKLSDSFSRKDAMKFCGFIGAILLVLGKAKINNK
ncbi:hypothetical protein HY490_00505 [Candidatus Woesearchaeota archaeon]|nr:hypothetical protein [Candidatus Woesearchaeota archaeon]